MGMESNRNQIANAYSHTHYQGTTKATDKQSDEKEHRRYNITYMQAGVSCFVGQKSGKFKIQFFIK